MILNHGSCQCKCSRKAEIVVKSGKISGTARKDYYTVIELTGRATKFHKSSISF